MAGKMNRFPKGLIARMQLAQVDESVRNARFLFVLSAHLALSPSLSLSLSLSLFVHLYSNNNTNKRL